MEHMALFQQIDVATFHTIFQRTSKLNFSLLPLSNKGVNNNVWFIPFECSSVNCQFEPYGYIYPNEQNCLIDKELLATKGKIAECYPVEGIIRVKS
ncbi:hypothetical protein PROPEN_02022 [Proteus penneri ATCC 35198]|nr:hypothetical protein PROPEN_02022 [Proteus penneri ATCC 35198]